MTNITTLTQAIRVSPEELSTMGLATLAELHKLLGTSKQKAAIKQAQLVADLITTKKAELSKKAKANKEKLATVENSVKPKAPAKPKRPTKPAQPKADEPTEAQEAEQEAPKKPSKPKAPSKPRKPQKAKPKTPEEMTKEELLVYIQAMQEKQQKEIFPDVIDGEKIRFKQVELKTIEDVQKAILENPLSLYAFMDEKLDDDLTQFTVLFANADVFVFLDRTRQKDKTLTFKPSQLKDGIYKDQYGSFPTRFYIREVK